jgi:HEAT repeat protein
MGFSQKGLKKQLFLALSSSFCLFAEEEVQKAEEIDTRHIGYLMQIKELTSSINLYQEYRKAFGRHNFEVLQQMAMILLDQGAHSNDTQEQLLSIFGSSIAGIFPIEILDSGVKSPNPETQMAAIQLLGRMQDDRADELLNRAMSSDFIMARMIAAEQLAIKKHRTAVGQIESLMYRLPPPFRAYFPPFFALIGTADAIRVLKHLMDDPQYPVRIESILFAGMYGRDDLLPSIRAKATHLNSAEQEACVAALGMLKDSKSIPLLKKLSSSPSANVQLAALKSLFVLGDMEAKEKILEHAKAKDLFAIAACAEIPGSEDVLADLMKSDDIQIRYNAAFSLLIRKDPRCVPAIFEIVVRDSRDIGYQPQYSLGKSAMAWKIIPSLSPHAKNEAFYDLQAVSVQVREFILRNCLELPEKNFLAIANRIFDSRQSELVPVLVSLLENLHTEDAILLLQNRAQAAGAPLMRAYCTLSLYRMGQPGPYDKQVEEWITKNKKAEMIRFRPMVSWQMRLANTSYELTPEESSRLLVESYQTLALKHEEKSIDLLLDAIKDGNEKNRCVLAGLLLLAIQ